MISNENVYGGFMSKSSKLTGRKQLTIHFSGGLGNQLFQLTYLKFQEARGLKVNGEYGTLPVRKNSFGHPWIEEICVPKISLKKTRLHRKLIFRVFIFIMHRKQYFYLRTTRLTKGFALSRGIFSKTKTKIITEIGFNPEIHYPHSGDLFGYFQSNHWADLIVSQNFVKIPKLPSELYSRALIENPLIVHVRIGDYSENPEMGILGVDYYHTGISEFLNSCPNASIWLFSDTPESALSRIPIEFHKIVHFMDSPNDSPLETLEKMRLGAGYVLANSTLSWWAAYLAYNSSAPVFAPSPWFKELVEPKNLFPSNWVRRDARWEHSSGR